MFLMKIGSLMQKGLFNLGFRKYDFYQMVKVDKRDTGLPYDIFLESVNAIRKKWQHIPNIKVKTDDKMIHISIEEQPKALNRKKAFQNSEEVFAWIRKNRKKLLQHWQDKLTDKEILNLLS